MKAEDRAADAILEALSEEERRQLQSITEKICKTCEELGADYAQIKERKGGKGCRLESAFTADALAEEDAVALLEQPAAGSEGEWITPRSTGACRWDRT